MSDALSAADGREIMAALSRIEPALTRMDERLRTIEAQGARMDERLSYTATREDLAGVEGRLRTEMAEMNGSLRAELATKPSRGSMWAMAIALVALVVASIGAGAAYLPLVQSALRP